MAPERNQRVDLYVSRAHQQWVVRDPNGRYWLIPCCKDAWESRAPFSPTAESELEQVPGHYKYLLELPA